MKYTKTSNALQNVLIDHFPKILIIKYFYLNYDNNSNMTYRIDTITL